MRRARGDTQWRQANSCSAASVSDWWREHLFRHSGARRSREPGIHNPRARLALGRFAQNKKEHAYRLLFSANAASCERGRLWIPGLRASHASRNDEGREAGALPPLEIGGATLGGGLDAFLEVLGGAQPVLLDQFVIGRGQHAVG